MTRREANRLAQDALLSCMYLNVEQTHLICFSSVSVHFWEAEREWRASPSASWEDSSGQSQVVDVPLLGPTRFEPWLAQSVL